MTDELNWKQLSNEFALLVEKMRGSRIDYQWGSVPRQSYLTAITDRITKDRFTALCSICGSKIILEKNVIKRFPELKLFTDPVVAWFQALKELSNSFVLRIATDQKDFQGNSIGMIYQGNVLEPASCSSNLCLQLMGNSSQKKTTTKRIVNKNKIPKRTEKKIFQESNSQCSFCNQNEITLLDIHHIVPRMEGGSNDESNLILVCKKCHTDIEEGIVEYDEVIKKKKELSDHNIRRSKEDNSGSVINLNNNMINSSIIANTVKFPSKNIKIAHPVGSIGSDINKKNYISYLIDRYYDYRKLDSKYGRIVSFNHAVIHNTIRKKFRAKTYFIPVSRFEELVDYLKFLIDRTIQGKRNKSNSTRNFETYNEYIALHGDLSIKND